MSPAQLIHPLNEPLGKRSVAREPNTIITDRTLRLYLLYLVENTMFRHQTQSDLNRPAPAERMTVRRPHRLLLRTHSMEHHGSSGRRCTSETLRNRE